MPDFRFDQPLGGFRRGDSNSPARHRAPSINEQIRWVEPFEGTAHDYEATVVSELMRAEGHFPYSDRDDIWDDTARRGSRSPLYASPAQRPSKCGSQSW